MLFVYLNFKAKPSFLEPLPGIYTVPKGTSVLMTSTVEGNPPPNITWLRNNKPLKDEPGDIKIDLQGNISTLSVGQCELQDEGNYVCVAENHLGQISCCTKLEVQGNKKKTQHKNEGNTNKAAKAQDN